jgi:aspartyl-tRNA(Asn)/glutamyl-tRNA(Gln) amidotransferase subunit A
MTDADGLPGTIVEAARQLDAGAISAVALTQGFLDRIAVENGRLAPFITVMAESALAEARASDEERARGRIRGPLHGIPYAAKDLYATAGVRTTAHSHHLIDHVPDHDAACVRRLREAGAILLGKTATHEFAFGGPADDLPFPPARNPWDPERIPSGSSSGSAVALAAHLCLGALGSDTGGSIREPSAYCGIVGLKPTFGRVSRAGVVRLADSLDHAGPMARSVDDCALLLQAIAGRDPADPATVELPVPPAPSGPPRSLAGVRVGVFEDLAALMPSLAPSQAGAQEEAVETLRGLGAEIVTLRFPDADLAIAAARAMLYAEAYALHAHRLRTNPDAYCRVTRERITMGLFVDAGDYLAAKAAQPRLIRSVDALLEKADVLALPAADGPAGRFADRRHVPFSVSPDVGTSFNVTGHPVLTLPCGEADGMPLGLQIAGRRFDEAMLCLVGRAFEAVTPWHARQPPRRQSSL